MTKGEKHYLELPSFGGGKSYSLRENKPNV